MMMSTLLFLQPTAAEAGTTVTSHFVVTGTLLRITKIPHSRSPKFPRGLSGVEGLI
jgi:hypothetical protein